jgi:hypothetical protein
MSGFQNSPLTAGFRLAPFPTRVKAKVRPVGDEKRASARFAFRILQLLSLSTAQLLTTSTSSVSVVSRLLPAPPSKLQAARSQLPSPPSDEPEPPCKSGQLKKDLGLEVSSARHAARLVIFEIMRAFSLVQIAPVPNGTI